MRSSVYRFCACVCAFLLLFGVVLAQAAPVLMISIDGLKPEYVTQADAHGMKLPFLRSMMVDGAYAEGIVGIWPTITYPSHTTLITGVWLAGERGRNRRGLADSRVLAQR